MLYFVADTTNGRITNDMSYMEAFVVREHLVHERTLMEMECSDGPVTYEDALTKARNFYTIEKSDATTVDEWTSEEMLEI